MQALLVDDSRMVRMVVGNILKEIGFEVFEAGNGLEGLKHLEQAGGSDLVIVDWNMPEMNGYEFVCKVRAQPAYDNTRLLMVTAESEIDQISKALEAGADEYLMKPFDKEAVLDKLALMEILPS